MSKTLATLIKRSEYAVEAVQKKLAQTNAAEAATRSQIDGWNEKLNTTQSDAEALTLGAFVARGRTEIAKLQNLLQSILTLKETQTAELRTHFTEQKRYEILLNQKQTAAKLKTSRKQQNALDEAAGVLNDLRKRAE